MAHGLGKRAYISTLGFARFNTSMLDNRTYTRQWIASGVNATATRFPWADGLNLDLEHFPAVKGSKQRAWQADLARMLCELQAALQAAGLRLHSMDLGPHQPPWGVFNISALAQCVDYLLPMAYCSPASNTVAGPTLPLSKFKAVMREWSFIPPSKIIVGLPAFGGVLLCTNERPAALPRNASFPCLLEQPVGGGDPAFPLTPFYEIMELWRTEDVTTGGEILYDSDKAAAWFEFRNRTSGKRYQVRATG